MYNTIILFHGSARLTAQEFSRFSPCDTLFGLDADPQEVQRWCIADEADARAALNKLRCSYTNAGQLVDIDEYGLMFCNCDDSGYIIDGADWQPAVES